MLPERSFTEACNNYLHSKWDRLLERIDKNQYIEPLGEQFVELKTMIVDCITSKTKSYHYVLPTQLLAKAVDHSLDCRTLQASCKLPGAFDARTIAHSVIVPFDSENSNVLGGSPEPYVNNPLRTPAVIAEFREKQKNKNDWDKLTKALEIVQKKNDTIFTKNVFEQVLFEIYKLLSGVRVVYPTPSRISLKQTITLIQKFISEKSGGERIEAIATVLFQTIGDKFGLFDRVKREKVTTADSSSGMAADIECWSDDKIVLLVETKDRNLTLTQIDAKLDSARAGKITEILFIAQKGVELTEKEAVEQRIVSEFISGQNVYITDLLDFARSILLLLGEQGRVDFISRVGLELDRVHSAISNRKAWAALLKSA